VVPRYNLHYTALLDVTVATDTIGNMFDKSQIMVYYPQKYEKEAMLGGELPFRDSSPIDQ